MSEKFKLETFKDGVGTTYYGVITTEQCEWVTRNQLVGEIDIKHGTFDLGTNIAGWGFTPAELRELADYVEKHLEGKETENA